MKRLTLWSLASLLVVGPAWGQDPTGVEKQPGGTTTAEVDQSVMEPVKSKGVATPLADPVVTPPLQAAVVAGDPDAVFRAFSVFAEQEKAKRFVMAGSGIVLGGATMGIGGYVSSATDSDPKVWYIAGAIGMAGGALSLFLPSAAETLAAEHVVKEPGHSAADAAAFEKKWKSFVHEEQKKRVWTSGLTLVLAGMGVGAGIAIAAGAGDFGEDERIALSATLTGAGAVAVVPAVAGLVVKGPAERAYDEYVQGRPRSATTLAFSMGGLPGGATLGAQGTF